MIGCDLDGVLVDPGIPVAFEVSKLTGFCYTKANFVRHDFVYEDVLKRTSNRALAEKAQGLWYDAAVLSAAPRCPQHARLAVLTMRALGLGPVVITSRLPKLAAATRGWMGESFPEIGSGRIHVRDSGGESDGDGFKAERIAVLRPVAFFEDQPRMITDKLLARGLLPRERIRMLDQPWNWDCRELDDMRVSGWLAALPFICWLRLSL
jgi:hypothetical protein